MTGEADALERQLNEARNNDITAMGYLADCRIASGDNGKRMLPEFVEYLREMKRQRDELLTAVIAVVDAWSSQFERNGHLAPSWCKQARTAIANAEKQMKIDIDEVVQFVMQADEEYGIALAEGLNKLRTELEQERKRLDWALANEAVFQQPHLKLWYAASNGYQNGGQLMTTTPRHDRQTETDGNPVTNGHINRSRTYAGRQGITKFRE